MTSSALKNSASYVQSESLNHSDSSETLESSIIQENIITTRFKELKDDVILFIKCFLVLIATWVLGFFNMSFSYLLIGILGYVSYRRIYSLSEKSIRDKMIVARDAKSAILTNMRELPKWVFFPDVEKADWINTILEQLWPCIVQYINNYMRNSIIPDIDGNLPSYLQPFIFTEMDLGDIPPRVGGVKVYSKKNVRRGMVILDLEISYSSDAVISVRLNKIKGGIKNFSLRGTLRVILSPLIPQIPFVGAASVCFLTNPELEFNLTDFGNILELPGVRQTMFHLVKDLIASMIVLPERMTFPLAENVDLGKLKHPLPDGVLRVLVKGAKELVKADFGVFGGTSDPYVELRVGSQKFKTKTIKKNINPNWNEYFDAIVDEKTGQKLEFTVYDEDPGKDDFIGCGNIDIEVVNSKAVLDTWIQLEQVKTGSIHFQLEWMDLSSEPLAVHAELHSKEVPVNSAYLSVFIDSAHNLNSKRSIDEPFPFVTVTLDNKELSTESRERTRDPVWERHFQFLVFNPEIAELKIVIKNKAKNNTVIGTRNIPLKSLLQEPDMVSERGYSLKGADPNAQIFLRLALRALIPGRIRNCYDGYTRKSLMNRRETINESRKSFYNRMDSLNESKKSMSKVDTEESASGLIFPTRSFSFVDKVDKSSGEPKAERKNSNHAIFKRIESEGDLNKTDSNADHQEESHDKTSTLSKCMPKKKRKQVNNNNNSAVIEDSQESDSNEFATSGHLSPIPSTNMTHSPKLQSLSPSRTSLGRRASPFSRRRNGQTVESDARIQLTIRYNAARECLVVVVHQIVKLRPFSEDGSADPYVKLTLLPKEIISSKKKTSHKKGTLNPTYDEALEFHLNPHNIPDSILRIDVMNHSNRATFSKHKREMEFLEIPLREHVTAHPTTEWFSLMSKL